MSMTPPPPPPPPGAPPPPPPMPPGGGFAAAGPVSPAGQPLASAGVRIGARLLDSLILFVVFGAIAGAVFLGDDGFLDGDISTGKLLGLNIALLAIGFVWEAVLTKLYGGTPMKLAFGLKVVRADNGGPVEWSHAIKRWAVPAVLNFIPNRVLSQLLGTILAVVSLVFLFTKPNRQTVWDQIGGTLVVKSR